MTTLPTTTTGRRRSRRPLTVVTAVAAALIGGLLAAGPAAAAVPDESQRLPGTITLTAAENGLPNALTIDAVCPTDTRAQSRFLVIHADGSVFRVAGYFRNWGTWAAPTFTRSQTGVADATLWGAATAGLKPGDEFGYYVTCEKVSQPNGHADIPADARFWSIPLVWEGGGQWRVKGDGPVAEATTVALAGQENTDGSVTLTATVKKADGETATDAAGQVRFTQAEGGDATATVPVENGVATWTSPALAPGTAYRFVASYLAAEGENYDGSPESAGVTGTIADNREVHGTEERDVTVTIPEAQTGIKLTVTPGAIALDDATLQDGSYVADGTLPAATVSDNRETRPAWTLSGQVTDFTTSGTPANTIDGQWLGWTPNVTSGLGTAGATVAPGEGGGLKTGKTLAAGAADLAAGSTQVGAALRLAAPGTTAAGDYTAKLTITLVS